MADTPVSVLIVDDSALVRSLVGRIVEEADGLSLAGKAINGNFALRKLDALRPDIILLDLEMPEMNGIDFLKERRRRGIEIPVIILSSIAEKGARITMEALNLGASDFLLKPSGKRTNELKDMAETLTRTLVAYGRRHKTLKKKPNFPVKKPQKVETASKPQTKTKPLQSKAKKMTDQVDIVAIGISTGGPNALRLVLRKLKVDLPTAVLIVQHMPPGFTSEFADSLDKICPLSVVEARDGDLLRPGRIFIAPGDMHMLVERRRLATVISLSQDPPAD